MAGAVDGGERRYGGVAAPERRAERRARLWEAGLELLGTRGMNATTVTAVCELARLTPRYFYESFRDREDLLVSIFDGIVEEVNHDVLEALAASSASRAKAARGAATADPATPADAASASPGPIGDGGDIRDLVHATIATWVEIAGRDPRRARAVFVEAYGSETLMRRRMDSAHRFAELLTRQASATHELSRKDARALHLAGLLIAGALIQTMIDLLDGGLGGSPRELIENYTRLCCASIAAAMPPAHAERRSPGPRASAPGRAA